MVAVEQRPPDVHGELWWVDENMQLLDLRANYHLEAKLVFEKLWTNFWDGLLEETRRSNDKNALN